MCKAGWNILRSFETREESLQLRRIFDFHKFKSLLETQALYFSPASFFDDELEGHYTTLDHDKWESQLLKVGFAERELLTARQAKETVAKENQKATVISCWSSSKIITEEMWSEYAPLGEGIAIETNVGRLRKCLDNEFLIIPVRYIDFNEETIPKNHSMEPYFFKQDHFSWEEEVRLIGHMEMGKRIGSSREYPISLSLFIERIKVHSSTNRLFLQKVSNLVEQYVPGLEVQK